MSLSIQDSGITSGFFEKLGDDVISKIYNHCDIKTWESLRSTNRKMKVMSERYISNTTLASSIVFHHPHLYKQLRSVSVDILEQDSVALSAVSSSPELTLVPNFLPNSLKNDPEVKKTAYVAISLILKEGHHTAKRRQTLKQVEDILIKDEELKLFAKKFNREDPDLFDELLTLHPFILLHVKKNGLLLKFTDQKFLKNYEIVLEAVKQNGLALEFADSVFQDDEDLVLDAVKRDGLILQFASERLKNTPRIVLAAMKQNPKARAFAGICTSALNALVHR